MPLVTSTSEFVVVLSGMLISSALLETDLIIRLGINDPEGVDGLVAQEGIMVAGRWHRFWRTCLLLDIWPRDDLSLLE